jgi:hypothetical protein
MRNSVNIDYRTTKTGYYNIISMEITQLIFQESDNPTNPSASVASFSSDICKQGCNKVKKVLSLFLTN